MDLDKQIVPLELAEKLIQNVSDRFFDVATAAGKFAKNPCSKIALDRFFDRLKSLEKDWFEFGIKYELVLRENDHLLEECERERKKSETFGKRFKELRENHENMHSLEEALTTMRNTKVDDMIDKNVQTDTNNWIVNTGQKNFQAAQETLQEIKEMIALREANSEKKNKEICRLNQIINKLQNGNDELMHKLDEKINCDYKNTIKRINNRCSMYNIGTNSNLCNIGTNRSKTSNLSSKSSLQERLSGSSATELIRSIRSSIESLQLTENESMSTYKKKLNKGDSKEVEALKKIRKEIEKKHLSITDTIDCFNVKLQ